MRRLLPLLVALLCPMLLAAQSLDSVRTDSLAVTHWDRTVRSYYTRVVQAPPVTDTLYCTATACSTVKPTPVDTAVPPPPVALGLPYGAFRLLIETSTPAPLTLTTEMNTPSTIADRIAYAKSKGVRLILQMTGGSHSATNPGCCLSIINGVLQFDHAKWTAKMATFNTAAIKDAVARGVTDGTIAGANVMDEPNVCGAGDGNTWGPCGTMTKVRVDSLCTEVQQIFPTLPAGVAHQVLAFEPTKSYKVCQFIVGGIRTKDGTTAQYIAGRDSALAIGVRDHHAIMFNLNVLDGGVRDTDGTWDCISAGQAGKGTYSPMCRMTADRVRERGLLAGPYGCGLMMWRYDDAFWGRTDNQASFKAVADSLARTPRRGCRRS